MASRQLPAHLVSTLSRRRQRRHQRKWLPCHSRHRTFSSGSRSGSSRRQLPRERCTTRRAPRGRRPLQPWHAQLRVPLAPQPRRQRSPWPCRQEQPLLADHPQQQGLQSRRVVDRGLVQGLLRQGMRTTTLTTLPAPRPSRCRWRRKTGWQRCWPPSKPGSRRPMRSTMCRCPSQTPRWAGRGAEGWKPAPGTMGRFVAGRCLEALRGACTGASSTGGPAWQPGGHRPAISLAWCRPPPRPAASPLFAAQCNPLSAGGACAAGGVHAGGGPVPHTAPRRGL